MASGVFGHWVPLPSAERRKGNGVLEFLVIGFLLVANLCPRRYGRERVIFLAYYGAAWGLGLLSVVLCQRLSGSSNLLREVPGSMCTVSPKKRGGGNHLRLEVGSNCHVRSYKFKLLSVVSRERLGEGKRKQGQDRVAQ